MTLHLQGHHPGAEALVASTLARAIRPVAPLPFREWLPQNIVLVDGPKKGEFWSIDDAPYLGAIADCLSVEDPCTLVTVRKSQQTGVSILALAWCLYLAELAPDNILYALPSIDFLQDINSQKLSPLIDAWQRETGKEIIYPSISRSGAGSTINEKRFAGGSLALANANVATDLSGVTDRYGVKDEVSKWKTHTSGDDPETLFFGRFTAYRRTKAYKVFELSTPEIDTGDELGEAEGHCRIDRSFKRSDQRFWNIRCPECGFEQKQFFENFILDRAHPHKSRYQCENCTHEISEIERVVAVRGGRFVATKEGPDRHPGFHVDAFDSLMMSYEAIAEDVLSHSKPGGLGEKGIHNLVLGLPVRERGNAPDYDRLMERREDYPEGVIPADGLLVTAGADIQHNGIWVEVVAFAEDRQSWSIVVRFFEGATDDPSRGAWTELADFYRSPLIDVFKQSRLIDMLAVDGSDGGRMNQALEWARRHRDAVAIKGQPGRGVAAIGLPSKTSIRKTGKRKRFGSAMLWPVGTWGLKSELMANLHKPGLAAGADFDPPGYCHFSQNVNSKEYFMQLTAESFVSGVVKGKFKEEWKVLRRDNHLLDCRVYAMAMAEKLGLTTMGPEEWASLRAMRRPSGQPDLLTPLQHRPKADRAPEPQPAAADKEARGQQESPASERQRRKWGQR
ncbi:terminase gpA endonuclease subunit [Amorphus orientalis]|uniref:Phage terminase large subunit GpA-like protein n=1 Tax=Amorphus orientalis TaxID=649198 RepID=A0AAE3VMS7_9HYPH|nr:terminase gpA endonuclease subunit [Amorphus orientalis]MDQ0314840.1 phage terminase large subunit GpA-like protein [Amorphus orientalis]